jgi:murein DD-endopeptidase MepM/ murein hydrolase activator NlpD
LIHGSSRLLLHGVQALLVAIVLVQPASRISGLEQGSQAVQELSLAPSPIGLLSDSPVLAAALAVGEAQPERPAEPAIRLARAEPPPEPFSYTVQVGDTLASIAERFDIDVPSLAVSNELDDPDLLTVGSLLQIPPVPGVVYRVGEGDTLNRIAARYELTTSAILSANNIENSELIQPGQALVLPGAKVYIARAPDPAPVAETVAETTAASSAPAAASSSALRWPAGGRITTYFGQVGWTSPRGHAGLDIAAPWGAPVAAAASGQVALATRSGGDYGILVVLEHGSGIRTVYGHLSELRVRNGQQVERGEIIGLVGSTGFSTGPHLHFEVRQNGSLRDPLSYLP